MQYPVINHNGKEYEKICICLNHFAVHQGNHKSKTYNRFTKTKKKGTQAYYERKSNYNIKTKRNEQRRTTKTTGKQGIKWQ